MTEDLDIKLIKYAQDGLPLTKTPYKDIADGVGMTEEEGIDRLTALLQTGKTRRLIFPFSNRAFNLSITSSSVMPTPSAMSLYGVFVRGRPS